MKPFLVVGAGLTGAVFASQLAKQYGRSVIVVDERFSVAGNAHDGVDECNNYIQTFGPHIFHTNSDAIWEFVQRFADWKVYFHRVTGVYKGTTFSLPLNLEGLSHFLNPKDYHRTVKLLTSRWKSSVTLGELQKDLPVLAEHDVVDIQEVIRILRRVVLRRYSELMWGMSLEDIEKSMPQVINRVPLRLSFDDRYFTDKYQGIPAEGYTNLVKSIISDKNILIKVGTKYEDLSPELRELPTLYTGAIDRFFDYSLGKLEYRSVMFSKTLHVNDPRLGRGTTLNFLTDIDVYPNSENTRVTSMKKLTPPQYAQCSEGNGLDMQESPTDNGPPMYPIPTPENLALYKKYEELAPKNIWFAGRLGSYQYLNMDQAIGQGLMMAQRIGTIE